MYSFPITVAETSEALQFRAFMVLFYDSRACLQLIHSLPMSFFPPSLLLCSLALSRCVSMCARVHVCVRLCPHVWVSVSLLAHMMLADPAQKAPPPAAPAATGAWSPFWMCNIVSDPRAEFLGPGGRHYDSMEAVEARWEKCLHIPFPVSTIRSGGKPAATGTTKKKNKNTKKAKKETSPVSVGSVRTYGSDGSVETDTSGE